MREKIGEAMQKKMTFIFIVALLLLESSPQIVHAANGPTTTLSKSQADTAVAAATALYNRANGLVFAAQLVLASPNGKKNPAKYAKALADAQKNLADATTALANARAAAAAAAAPPPPVVTHAPAGHGQEVPPPPPPRDDQHLHLAPHHQAGPQQVPPPLPPRDHEPAGHGTVNIPPAPPPPPVNGTHIPAVPPPPPVGHGTVNIPPPPPPPPTSPNVKHPAAGMPQQPAKQGTALQEQIKKGANLKKVAPLQQNVNGPTEPELQQQLNAALADQAKAQKKLDVEQENGFPEQSTEDALFAAQKKVSDLKAAIADIKSDQKAAAARLEQAQKAPALKKPVKNAPQVQGVPLPPPPKGLQENPDQ